MTAKFNEKRETKHVPSETNKMGEAAYKLTPEEELVSTVLTTFVQRSYYETEHEVLRRIRKAAENCDPLFVAKTAIYARTAANMRSSSHVLASEIAPRVSGAEWGTRFYDKIIVRVDDMSEIFSYYQNVMKGKGIPNAMRKGFKHNLESLDPYLIDKYKMLRRGTSLIDLVRIVHPVPTQKNKQAYELLMSKKGKGLSKLYDSKILEKEMSKAGVNKDSKEKVEAAKKEAIEDVLGNVKGMPVFNLLRNLRNILLYAPDSVGDAIDQLTIPEKIHKSKLLPFRFLSAHIEVSNMDYDSKDSGSSSIVFEDEIEEKDRFCSREEFSDGKKRILAAIEKATELSCDNIPELEGRTAILIDHSGSMRGDSGGDSLVSVLSKTRTVDIADTLAAMFLSKQKNTYVGLFGNNLVHYNVKRELPILQMVRDIYQAGRSCGANTENGIYLFFEDMIKNKVQMDTIVIFSDVVIGNGNHWYGLGGTGRSSGSFNEVFKEFRKLFPGTKVVSVDIKQTDGTTVFNKNYNVTQVAGWSESIFDVIAENSVGYKAIIEEINKIVI